MEKNTFQKFVLLDGDYKQLIRQLRFVLENNPKPAFKRGILLRLVDIDHALGLYEKGALSGGQLKEWAEILEMNENIDYEDRYQEIITDVLFRLSTPEINEKITPALVRGLRVSLHRARSEK